MINACQKAFEEWFLQYMGYPQIGLRPSSFCNRTYEASDVEYMWIGWKARNMYKDSAPKRESGN